MTTPIHEILERIELREPVSHGSLTIHPLRFDGAPGPAYRALATALEAGTAEVTEVDEGGRVPDLKLVNRDEAALLVLDGEELHGAKQNRVLNTTILVAAGAEVVIPVSCTEQGRWSYRTRRFSPSDQVMPRRSRSLKMASVSASLKGRGSYDSDQGMVWDEVARFSRQAEVHSPTGAMSDVFAEYGDSLAGYVAAFPCGDGQAGLLAVVAGEVAGFDFVSRADVYAALHPKLVRSYAMEALIRDRIPVRTEDPGEGKSPAPAGDPVPDFLAAVAQCAGEAFASVGLGEDVRYRGPDAIGTALVVDGGPVHGAFFPRPEDRAVEAPGMLRSSRRAGNLLDRLRRR